LPIVELGPIADEEQRRDGDLSLEPSQRRADTEVKPIAERDVTMDIIADRLDAIPSERCLAEEVPRRFGQSGALHNPERSPRKLFHWLGTRRIFPRVNG